jgi:two-component system LytT family response regulator
MMNCIIVEDDQLSTQALLHLANQVDDIKVAKTCSSSIQALDVIRNENIDLVFLDVELPGMSGIDMLKAIDKRPLVILTTSQTKYAIDAFELNVVDYLIKPLTLPRFMKAINKTKDFLKTGEEVNVSKDYVFIKNNSVFEKIIIDDILYIEALGDYTRIYTKEKRYVIHTTLKSLEVKLPGDKFVRSHRSYIIQIDSVKKIEDTTIFINDISIPIGAVYKDGFIKRLNMLC